VCCFHGNRLRRVEAGATPNPKNYIGVKCSGKLRTSGNEFYCRVRVNAVKMFPFESQMLQKLADDRIEITQGTRLRPTDDQASLTVPTNNRADLANPAVTK